MARKKKGRKQPVWRRWARMGVGALGAAVGLIVGLSPTYRGLGSIFRGDIEGGSSMIVYDTTGMDPRAGNLNPDPKKILATAVLIGVGIGLTVGFRQLARRI